MQSERNGKYYIGFSEGPGRRVEEHNRGEVKATRYARPWRLVYAEECADATSARKREYQLKAMKSRAYLEALIGGDRAG